MRRFGLSSVIIGLLLAVVLPVSAAPLAAGSVGIVTVVCKDTATVAVSGTASYATNRVKVKLYKQNTDGSYELFRTVNSENFGSGDFMLAVLIDYSTNQVRSRRPPDARRCAVAAVERQQFCQRRQPGLNHARRSRQVVQG